MRESPAGCTTDREDITLGRRTTTKLAFLEIYVFCLVRGGARE